VSVLLRNAANTDFDPKVDFATGSYPRSISVGDFNGDGKTDLAVANINSDTVSVLLRNAANTGFEPKVDFATGSYSTSISVGDFNGDGKLDLAVANGGGNTVSVLLRNAANTGFEPKEDFATGTAPSSVSVGDFNGDGKLDLAVANYYSYTVSVLLRNAANTGFEPKVGFAVGSNPTSVSIGDFNGDGKLDLAVANSWSDTVSVLLNSTSLSATLTITDNTPTLTAFASTVASGTEDSQIAVTFANLQTQGNEADVNGTVNAFVIKAVSTGSLKIGASAATATAWNASSNNAVDTTNQAFWTPAANANGSLNAFTVVAKDNRGLESATAIQAKAAVTPVNDAPTGVVTITGTATKNQILTAANTLADVDGLGTIAYQWLANGTAITGATASTLSLAQAQVGKTITVKAAYTDQQGTNESVTSSPTSSVTIIPTVTVTAGITPVEGASGSFIVTLDSPAPAGGLTINYNVSGTATLNTDYTVSAGANITAVTAGSFTIAAGQTTANLTINAVYDGIADPNETIKLRLSQGTGYQFSYPATFDPKVDVATGSFPMSVSVGDFNGDGKTDLAVANANSHTVSVLLRNAANTGFEPKVDFATDITPFSVSVGDFNGDGKTDLVVANFSSDTVSVLLRNAANTGFEPKVDFAVGSNPSSVSVGDFNGDGKTDLAVANSYSNTVSVLLRNAANTGFDPKVDFATGMDPRSVSVGDFNGDGKTDLVVANYSSGAVSVLLRNAANTGFDPKVDFATDSTPSSVSVGDFNGDGKTDLAVANLNNNTVLVLLRNAANTGFEPEVDVATGSYPISVSVGDFNGDGKTDLAVANRDSNTVSVLLRNAANTGFDPKVDFATGLYPKSIGVGDFNGDGKTDLAVTNTNSNTVSVLLNSTLLSATLTITDNAAPTLTAFASTVASGNEDSQVTVTFANLQTQGNEADVNGTVTAFVIKAVSTGSLKIGASAATATAWNASSNTTVDTTNQAFWTPAANANGSLNAFTVVAKDNGGVESATAIQAKVAVTPVNDTPTGLVTITGTATQNQTLTATNTLADIDGLGTIKYQWLANGTAITGATASTLTLAQAQVGKTITVQAAYTDLLGTAEKVTSSATTSVVNVNDAPVLIQPSSISYTDTAFDDTFATATGSLSASDIDGNALTYGITGGIDNGAGAVTQTSAYGVLTVTKVTGAYSFVTNDAAINALNAPASTSFTVTASDGLLSDSKTLAINMAQLGVTESIGNNTLTGTTGNDKINGLAGNDTIQGLAGNDTLIGGLGTDLLTGGIGSDTFVFKTSAESVKGLARDTIKDFTHSQVDKIDLAGIDANTLVVNDQAFTYIGATTFTGVAGQLDYVNGILAGDTNGDKVADFEIAITLVGGTSLVSADFVL